jgi:predicted nucleic-acid-binding Zn-ribbon protein
MKNAKKCPKCGHGRILHLGQVPDAGHLDRVQPMHIATVVTGKTFMGDDKLGSAGSLSACVCRACGYTELYVDQPAALPVDGKYVREL